MKAVVINMANAKERMQFMADQLVQLGIVFERFESITPETVSPEPDDPFWFHWERPLRDVEKALYMSHRTIWQSIADDDVPRLILEDDALLSPAIATLIKQLGGDEFDHISFETRGRTKALGPAHPHLPLRRLVLDRSGAAAYALWPSGARLLLARPAGLADAVICAQTGWRSWQAVPALAVQADRCAHYGLGIPLTTTSSTGASARPSARGLSALRFRGRRLASQIRMGFRQLSAIDRFEVVPAEDMDR